MSFSTPTRSRPMDDLLTAIELWFDDRYQSDDANWPSAPFLIRGGICWPDRYDVQTDSVRGCAVLLGYNLKADCAFVFEEQGFSCIDHILDPQTRAVLFPGLAPWFNVLWSRYAGDTFYVNQPDPVRDRWEMEARKSPVLAERPPRFVPCPEWRDIGAAESLIWEWLTRRRLVSYSGGEVEMGVKSYRKGDEKVLPASLHALAAALSGLTGQIEGAREVARSPVSLMKLQNQMMIDNPKDWRGNT